MANSLYQQMMQNQNNSMLNGNFSEAIKHVKQLSSMMQVGGNPQQLLSMLSQQNPQIGQLMTMVNSSGMSAKQLFLKMAQQKGIDAQQIINALKN